MDARERYCAPSACALYLDVCEALSNQASHSNTLQITMGYYTILKQNITPSLISWSCSIIIPASMSQYNFVTRKNKSHKKSRGISFTNIGLRFIVLVARECIDFRTSMAYFCIG